MKVTPADGSFLEAPDAASDLGGRVFTRRCPGCESGMEAPGIHRNARCTKANEPMPIVEDAGDEEMAAIPQETEFRDRNKRGAETPVEDCEEEIRHDRVEMLSELTRDSELGFCWVVEHH